MARCCCSPLFLLVAMTLLLCNRQFQADAKEVTREDLQQYLTPDKVDSSVAFIESTIGHALADRDLCVATALEASASASSDEEFFNRVDHACGFSFQSLLLGYQAAQEDGERPAERVANLNAAPSGSSNTYGAIGITSKVNTGSCAKVDRWYTIMAGGCTRCYELQPIINSFGPCGTSNFSLNPFPRGQVYLSFNLDCTSSTSGTLYLYDTPCSLFGPMPEPAKIMKLPGVGKSSCFETSPFSTENVYQGSTNFKFTCRTALCKPVYEMKVNECRRRIDVCGKKYGIGMKWTAAGCQINGTNQGDGGCQCKDYCGYTCESRCNADRRCSWNRTNNACFYKATPLQGFPEPFCETKSTPPSSGVVPIQVVTCFAGSATVLTEDGNRIPMRMLRVGQRVEVADYITGQKQFSPIIAFQHVGRDTETEFLKVIAEDGSSMMLSPDHVIFASIDGAPVRPMLADMLIPGKSSVWKSDSSTSMKLALVTKIDRVHARGFYAPLTFEGTIVVDGILASCYAGYWHKVMHVLFAPYRMFRRLFPVELREEDPLPGDGFMNYVENIFAFDAMFPTKENFRYR